MTVVTIDEAKEHIEELAQLATLGEEVVITQRDITAVTLTPVPLPAPRPRRVPGFWAGKFEVAPEFFEPLPDDELDLWEGNSPRGRELEAIAEAWASENRKANGSDGSEE